MHATKIRFQKAKNSRNPFYCHHMSRTGPKVSLNATQCKYSVIRNCALERQWKVVEKEDGRPKCNLYWIDTPEIQDIFRKLLPYQKVNHFPGKLLLEMHQFELLTRYVQHCQKIETGQEY